MSSYFGPLCLFVPGVPVPLGGAGEGAWRAAIVAAGHDADFGEDCRRAFAYRVALDFVFSRNPLTKERSDLDNLAIPALNALFKPQANRDQREGQCRGISDVEDRRVEELLLTKSEVAPGQEPGLHIRVWYRKT